MDTLLGDVRYAVRQLAKSPGFSLVVVLTLALGIGANAAIFSLMDQVVFRPLPVREPAQLVLFDTPGPGSGSFHSHYDLTPITIGLFRRLRDHHEVLENVGAYFATSLNVGIGTQTERASGALVSGTFFDTLGLKAVLGRLIGPADDVTPGAHPVVVLSHGYWTRRFASEPAVVGREIRINGLPMAVIGVAPAGFKGYDVGSAWDVYVPLMMQRQAVPIWDGLEKPRIHWLTAFARLAGGVTREHAQASLDVMYAGFLAEDLKTITTQSESFKTRYLQRRLALLPGGHGVDNLGQRSQTTFLVLMGMVGLVLLIACANVANLLLARATAREREVAVRLALGASRGRIVGQLLVESGLLALLGGALGVLVSSWTAALLIGVLPGEDTPRALSASPDVRVTLFAFGVTLFAGLLFGLAPALQATRPDLFATLRTEVGSVLGSAGPQRFRRGLVVAQVALSLLLLIGAGLFARSLANLRRLNPGFEAASLVTFTVDPSLNGYDDMRAAQLLNRVRDDLLAEPGVRAVSMANVALMTNSDNSSSVEVDGYQAKDGENMNPNFNSVAPGFFRSLGIPLLRGRDFSDADVAGAPRVAIVNEVFARYFFKDQDPIGRRFGYRRANALDITIVGVVKDGKASSLRDEPRRFVYVPYEQDTHFGAMTFYVQSGRSSEALAGRIRAVVRSADASLPVTELKSMNAVIGESLFTERITAVLSGAFGLVATLLAALGLYGVMAYAVARRTREIGIRMALGAERRALLAQVLGEVAQLAALGIGLGLPAALACTRLVRSQLFGLSASDPLTTAAAVATLALVSLAAGLLPAHRASRVDPMTALRYE